MSTYKEKVNIVVLLTSIFSLLIFSYLFPSFEEISNAILQYETLANSSENVGSSKQIAAQVNIVEVQLKRVNQLECRKRIIEHIESSSTNHSCKLIQILPNSSINEGDFKVSRNEFVLQGNFNSLLLVLQEITKKMDKFSAINSLKFLSKKNSQKNRSELFLTLIIYSLAEYK